MPNVAPIGPVFIAIAVIFLALTTQEFLNTEGKMTPARKTWLRIALIFAGISIALYALQIISPG